MSVSFNPSEVTAPLPTRERQGEGLLLVLLGPTAVGKTALSLTLAKRLSCPIISADSRQMYRGMNIGTAAPTEQELQEVPHYFVHTLDLDQYYSAAQYEADVLKLLAPLYLPPIGGGLPHPHPLYLSPIGGEHQPFSFEALPLWGGVGGGLV